MSGMRDAIGWLYGELPRLVAAGVLTPESAEALRRHYGPVDAPALRGRWGQILLACFGALLVGGGLILILAHNWDVLGRPARAAVAMAILLGAQALTLFAVARRSDSPAWTESTSGFLVAAVGAAIALVGQTYHLGGSFEEFMRAWLWLIVLIPYFTGSTLAAMGFWALLVMRATGLVWRDMPADPWLLVFAGAPFVLARLRRHPRSWATTLLAVAASGSVLVFGTLASVETGWNGLWAVFQITFLSAIAAGASWPPDEDPAGTWRGRLLVPAFVTMVIIGTIFTFGVQWRTPANLAAHFRNPNVLGILLASAVCTAFATVLAARLAAAGRIAAAVCSAAAPLVVVTHLLVFAELDIVGWGLFNLWMLALGVLTLVEGVRGLKLGAANRGLFALSVLVITRFFDTDLSFLARGLAFVMLGIACLVLNFWLMRRVRQGRP